MLPFREEKKKSHLFLMGKFCVISFLVFIFYFFGLVRLALKGGGVGDSNQQPLLHEL
jgi:hypothetical protein